MFVETRVGSSTSAPATMVITEPPARRQMLAHHHRLPSLLTVKTSILCSQICLMFASSMRAVTEALRCQHGEGWMTTQCASCRVVSEEIQLEQQIAMRSAIRSHTRRYMVRGPLKEEQSNGTFRKLIHLHELRLYTVL